MAFEILSYTALTIFIAAATATTALWSWLTIRDWMPARPRTIAAPPTPREPAHNASGQLCSA